MWRNKTGNFSSISYSKHFTPGSAVLSRCRQGHRGSTCVAGHQVHCWTLLQRTEESDNMVTLNHREWQACWSLLDECTPGACKDKIDFISLVIPDFGQKNPRRLQLLFKDWLWLHSATSWRWHSLFWSSVHSKLVASNSSWNVGQNKSNFRGRKALEDS